MQNSDTLQLCLCKIVISFSSVFMQKSDILKLWIYAK